MNRELLVELQAETLIDTLLLRFPSLAAIPGFSHAITTKPWNMGLRHRPDVGLAIRRRQIICDRLGFDFERLTCPDQIHSPHVLRVTENDIGAGRGDREDAIQFCDGLICDIPGVPIMQFSADCPIVVLVEPQRRIMGTAHASWRGTVAAITSELVRQLRMKFEVDPGQLVAAICPCAGPQEYEVGEIVRRIALSRLENAAEFFSPMGGKYSFDMRAANVDQLLGGGVKIENISVANASTITDQRFFSHRREGAATGRFAFVGGFSSRA